MKDLTVVIPTKNEMASLYNLVNCLTIALAGVTHEIIIIDDGNDMTPQIVEDLDLFNLWFIRRHPKFQDGLSGAVILGMRMSKSRYIAVMDGDGQHPPELIRDLWVSAVEHDADMVMASRYCQGGVSSGLNGSWRQFCSVFLRRLPRLLYPRLRVVTDPLSGCFLVRSSAVNYSRLCPIGWKVSLEILLFSTINRYLEVPYEFLPRLAGKSKANISVGLRYFQQLISLTRRYYFSLIFG